MWALRKSKVRWGRQLRLIYVRYFSWPLGSFYREDDKFGTGVEPLPFHCSVRKALPT